MEAKMAGFVPRLPRKVTALKQANNALDAVAFQIGVLFAVERNRKHFTQEWLGDQVGIDQGYVSILENGGSLPRSVTDEQIDELFELVGLTNANAVLAANFVKWWRDNL